MLSTKHFDVIPYSVNNQKRYFFVQPLYGKHLPVLSSTLFCIALLAQPNSITHFISDLLWSPH